MARTASLIIAFKPYLDVAAIHNSIAKLLNLLPKARGANYLRSKARTAPARPKLKRNADDARRSNGARRLLYRLHGDAKNESPLTLAARLAFVGAFGRPFALPGTPGQARVLVTLNANLPLT